MQGAVGHWFKYNYLFSSSEAEREDIQSFQMAYISKNINMEFKKNGPLLISKST